MIVELDHRSREVAVTIHRVLYDAYLREAATIGVDQFPPLRRTAEDIIESGNRFFGYDRGGDLLGVIELETRAEKGSRQTVIASLGVDPAAFRQGIGRALVRHVRSICSGRLMVSTGARNAPAIRLYIQLGFVLVRHHTSPEGVPLVDLEHMDG